MTHTPLRPAQSAGDQPEIGRAPRRRKLPWIVGGVLAVVAAGAGAYALSQGDEPATPTKASSAAQAAAAGGAEGTFGFTVTKSECGVASVGPAELPQRATGQFCLVNVSVKNTGTAPALLDPGAQKGVDGQGREHAVADQAGVFLNEQTPSLLEEIPPGATVSGVLAFDVPAGERLAAVVLHESVDSAGVRLPLS
jgi:hypothetical protein